jgi:hypothetical protein
VAGGVGANSGSVPISANGATITDNAPNGFHQILGRKIENGAILINHHKLEHLSKFKF